MSGMRPTGRLHLGHYRGVLKNWVSLQNDDTKPVLGYFMIADYHALTTGYTNTANMTQHVLDMTLDWLAAGINPERSVLYVQSQVPAIAELHLLLSMLTPAKWVETDPTLKDMVAMTHEDLSYGLLGYPVLQTADILAMRGHLVPVGKDQLAHLEISRDLARRFNHTYKSSVFPEPKPLLTDVSILKGLDGRKMGKSYANGINLADDEAQTLKQLKSAITDPNRIKRDMPGDPEACSVVYEYYKVFAPAEAVLKADVECRSAARGCVDCKQELASYINDELRDLRTRRKALATDLAYVEAVLKQGAEKACERANETLRLVKSAMSMYQPKVSVSVAHV
jgi:tryptophanyl-tRNA synthetase